MREKKDPEPFVCPECDRVIVSRRCPCGHFVEPAMKTQHVMQACGTLKMVAGDIYTPKVRKETPTTTKSWVKCYFRAKRAGMTFRQAEGLFVQENHFWPLKNLKLMPKNARDWYRKVADVPMGDLYT